MNSQPRTPQGSRDGGQFVATEGAESSTPIDVPTPCDRGCADAPEEDCSLHGRTPQELWGIIDELRATRDRLEAELAGARTPRILRTIEALDALPVGSLVIGGGEVYQRVTDRRNGDTFRCLNDATDYREWSEYSSETVLHQEFDDDGPLVHLVSVPVDV